MRQMARLKDKTIEQKEREIQVLKQQLADERQQAQPMVRETNTKSMQTEVKEHKSLETQTDEDIKLNLNKNKRKAAEYMQIKLQKELQMHIANPNLSPYQLMWQKAYNKLPDLASKIRSEAAKETFQRLNFVEFLSKVEPDFEMPKVNASDLKVVVGRQELGHCQEIKLVNKLTKKVRLSVSIRSEPHDEGYSIRL